MISFKTDWEIKFTENINHRKPIDNKSYKLQLLGRDTLLIYKSETRLIFLYLLNTNTPERPLSLLLTNSRADSTGGEDRVNSFNTMQWSLVSQDGGSTEGRYSLD